MGIQLMSSGYSPISNALQNSGGNFSGGGISLYDPFEDQLKKRMQLGLQQGMSQDSVNRAALVERALNNQQRQAQQAQAAQSAQPQANQPSGLKKFLVNTGALIGETGAGILGTAFAPVTGGASIAGAFGAGAGIEALKRKALGENQSVGASALEGGLTAIPGFGAARRLIRGGQETKAALGVANAAKQYGANDATKRAAELVPKMASRTSVQATQQAGGDFANFQNVMPKDQLAAKIHADTIKTGGATYDLAGNAPKSGYAYAPVKNTEFSVKGELTDKHITSFMSKHAAELAVPGNHIGTWVSDGKSYIDISRVGAPAAQTLADAQKAKQLAAFDLEHGNEIPLGKINKGVYNKHDEALSIHNQYQRENPTAGGFPGSGGPPEVQPGQVPGNPGQPPVPGVSQPGPAPQWSPHQALQDVLDKETTAMGGPGKIRQGIDNLSGTFTPDNGSIFANKLSGLGDKLTSGARGIEAGGRIQGTSSRLLPHQAEDINSFLDTVGAKGSAAKQLGHVENVQQSAGQHIGSVIERNNVPVSKQEITGIMDKVKGQITGENGTGIAGFNTDTHGAMANDFARQLASVKDLKGMQTFKQSLDDAVNYARKAESPDPIREQVARAFRGVVSEEIGTRAPEVGVFNKIYSNAAEAKNALVLNAAPKGVTTGIIGVGDKGLGGKTIQSTKDKLGRTIGGVGDVVGKTLSTPAMRSFAKQYGIRLLAGDEQAKFGANPAMPPANPNAPQMPTMDPNNPGGMGNPQGNDEQVINYALANGAKNFDDVSKVFDQVQAGGGIGGSGSASGTNPSNPLGFTREDLMQAAYQAVASGDKAALANIKTLNDLMDSYDKANASTSSNGTKLTIAQQKDVASVKNASGLLDAIEKQYSDAGGGKGILGYATHIPVLGQYVNTKMGAYNQTKIDAAVAYAQALAGSGRQPAEQIIMEVKNALPTATDTPAQAKQKLDNLRMHLGHREQTVLTYPYTSSDLPTSQSYIDQLLQGNNYGAGSSNIDLFNSLGI